MTWKKRYSCTFAFALLITPSNRVDARQSTNTSVHRETAWTSERKRSLRATTKDLWYHGFDHYMSHGPDWENPANIAHNDVSGNYSLTLIDVLDTLVVLDDPPGFQNAVQNVLNWVSFDVNTKPQVFETTIRVLGGLLSGHMFASQPGQPFYLPWYRGQLLTMAYDLGNRLLPAFSTPTGLPFARVNLRHGVQRGESLETCTAGAGSLILELATLSRLTGDDRFEKAAYKAFFALWNRRSDIGLVGNTINIWTGTWTLPEVTGIGAGVDSFYEYALKWYVMSGEVEFLDVWHEGYAAVMRYSRSPDGHWFRNINIHTGDQAYATIDSLSAFWPGLQVLGGDIQNAIKSHMTYWNIWRRHSGLPEIWDAHYLQATSFQYPLRPEFVESTWYLYRATRDPYYLDVGERILRDLIVRAKVNCGLTGIQDLRTNARDDRMESFALSETLKYLYLLFDEDNPLHKDDSHYVFTTEGHILSLPREVLKPMSRIRRKMRGEENHQCPLYEPVQDLLPDGTISGLIRGVGSRADVDYARYLVGLRSQALDEHHWSPDGWCAIPEVDLYSFDFIMSPGGKVVPEDPNPSPLKLKTVADGFILHNVTGIRAHVVSRLDRKGYDITKLGPHAVRTGQIVYVNDSALWNPPDPRPTYRSKDVKLRIFLDTFDTVLTAQPGASSFNGETYVNAYTAQFGGDLAAPDASDTLLFGYWEGTEVQQDKGNPLGCKPYETNFDGNAVLVHRGECAFLEKLVYARDAGASGVIVVSDEDTPINPSASPAEIAAAGDLSNVALVLLPYTVGKSVTAMVDAAGMFGYGHVMFAVDTEAQAWTEGVIDPTPGEVGQILYINGHPLLNTRLII
ncbi:glycoside hydrolase family 47 protein [Suillus bovinus]|uniref:glycoside hydrolase family 47 protein n=1 Tax=Suillus bovinus TaxID=48563 RepID=UPI001B878C9D|nr:glycoside hydrolase family 47 protein [Suillus bovinus]KAG2135913.1 glycoside hydrolase family 47 protein [Suillus bovinus]